MCGIFALLNHSSGSDIVSENIQLAFFLGKGRGPETSTIKTYDNNNVILGFHRLAINGLNPSSDQPLIDNDIE